MSVIFDTYIYGNLYLSTPRCRLPRYHPLPPLAAALILGLEPSSIPSNRTRFVRWLTSIINKLNPAYSLSLLIDLIIVQLKDLYPLVLEIIEPPALIAIRDTSSWPSNLWIVKNLLHFNVLAACKDTSIIASFKVIFIIKGS
jgi:hypothetical protein